MVPVMRKIYLYYDTAAEESPGILNGALVQLGSAPECTLRTSNAKLLCRSTFSTINGRS